MADIWFTNVFCFSAIVGVLIAAIASLPRLKREGRMQGAKDVSTVRGLCPPYRLVEAR